MEPAPESNPATRAAPGYHVWQAPGGSVTVHLSLDVVDRMLGDILTGFGAVPRRGAEVGGILIGSIRGNTVTVDDFVLAPCEYRRGPSYLLSESDQAGFARLFETWKPAPGRAKYAVGHFRSNTREQSIVGDEDRALMRQYFAAPANVMLMVRPYATKPSIAGFLTWEKGKLSDTPAAEFPFRRMELEGEPIVRRPLGARRTRLDRIVSTAARPESPAAPGASDTAPAAAPEPAVETPSAQPRRRRRTWVWVAVSLLSIVLGGVIGFQAALTFFARPAPPPAVDPYALSLAVATSGQDVHLTWDRRSAAMRSARGGVLEITDGHLPAMRRDLDAGILRTGSVIYHPMSDRVHFRVEVSPSDRSSVAATIDWHR